MHIKPLFLLFLLLFTLSTHARERIALVIGNSDYQISPLDNSINDARDIASTLKGLDFKVTLVEDANQQIMEEAIASFGEKLNKDTVGLFYYSGHAIQYNGSNYLIPIGAMSKVKKSSHLKYKTVPSGLILDEIEQSQSKLNFVFLDACRNSPFRGFSRGISPGLVKTESSQGTLISYSTAPGKVASDGVGKNSPYTKHLINQITKPNIQVEIMLKEVNAGVFKVTHGEQSPWYESSISGKFCFNEIDNRCGVLAINVISDFLIGVNNIEKLNLKNDLNYQGQIKDNKPHGKGILTWASGDRYEGEFKDGEPHGKGIFTWANGDRYKGEWKDGKKHGKAIKTWASGDRYEGDYKDDKQHGRGFYAFGDSRSYYEGEFKDNKKHGKGIYVFPKGTRYEGEFKDNLEHGKGVLNYTNGDVFEGEWKQGELIIISQANVHHSNGNRYKGEAKPIRNGEGYQMHGHGIFFEKDGSFHKGEWKNDKKHGEGLEVNINDKDASAVYVGIYKDGEKDNGILFMIVDKNYDTFVLNSVFKNGQMISMVSTSLSDPNIRMTMGPGVVGENKKSMYFDKVKASIKDGSKFTGSISISVDAGESLSNKASGLMIYENGTQYKGDFIFNDGVWSRTGHGVYTDIDGVQQKQEWNNGKEIL